MIHLTRVVPVHVFECEATVAIGRHRPEFLAVAQLAADLGRPIGANDVLRELLGPRPEVVGWKVIDRCVALGLLTRADRSGVAVLSDAGKFALEHGSVLVPEEGIWRLSYVDDPLLPDRLLHVERLPAETAKDERKAMSDPKKLGTVRPGPQPPPELLASCLLGDPFESVVQDTSFRVLKLGAQGVRGAARSLRLTLTWDAEPRLTLAGSFATDAEPLRVDAQVPVPRVVERLGREQLWMTLAARGSGVPVSELEHWWQTAGELVVPTKFDDGDPAAMRTFRREVSLPRLGVDGLGEFEATALADVHLVPAAPDDAQRWLEWLQWHALDGYATPPMLETHAADLVARFPFHHPRPRTPAELLARARVERGDRAWNLLAPHDLGLWS